MIWILHPTPPLAPPALSFTSALPEMFSTGKEAPVISESLNFSESFPELHEARCQAVFT